MSAATNEKRAFDPLLSLKTSLNQDIISVDLIIEANLHSSVPLIPTISKHLIYAGGKRLRPLLTLACYRLFEDHGSEATGLAAAVEFIHTATLLHDDVVDESRLRRGLPTANDLWGNQASILVGDFLLARAFQLIIESKCPQVMTILASAAASISEGEVLQLSLCHNLEVNIEDSLRVIEAKTATLFAAACEVGALKASDPEMARMLRTYGLNLGMAFQIVDDILDYCSHSSQLGKDIGDDFREGKITLPIILAYPQCDQEEKEFFKRTLIDHIQIGDDLDKALQILHTREGLNKAYDLAASYGDRAREALKAIPSHPLKDLLSDLIDHCLQRHS